MAGKVRTIMSELTERETVELRFDDPAKALSIGLEIARRAREGWVVRGMTLDLERTRRSLPAFVNPKPGQRTPKRAR